MSRAWQSDAAPTSKEPLPYGRQSIDESDVQAVLEVLRSDWLTTGPKVEEFEQAFADAVGTAEAVAVSSGTAALHAAAHVLDLTQGDEVIVPAITFAATANAVVYEGGTPVFADVEPDTLLIDANSVLERISDRTRAIIAVDYAGQPCDYDALRAIADEHDLVLFDDACHALGGAYKGKPVGSLADASTFSLHPVKPITTGEGGVITTEDPALARSMRTFRNHGITTDHRQREEMGSWFYEMEDLGFNYRLTDIQCALGTSQLGRLGQFVSRRREIAALYDEAFDTVDGVTPLRVRADAEHAYHLYVVRLEVSRIDGGRAVIFDAVREAGILVNVHYIPVHLHPYYKRRFGTAAGMCPAAETAYEELLTLPIFPAMTAGDVERVVGTLRSALERNSR